MKLHTKFLQEISMVDIKWENIGMDERTIVQGIIKNWDVKT
jgi:hypothetical protein